MAYRCILADPPWKYRDKLRMSDTTRSAEDIYKTVMDTDAICALAKSIEVTKHSDPYPVYGHSIMDYFIDDDALLALWVTCSFLLNGDGIRVCRAWGFEPKQLFTWAKGNLVEDAIVAPLGMGHIFRVDTEHLIIATRGKMNVLRHDERNYLFLEGKGRHSAKPKQVNVMLETMVSGPYLELFARERVDGWDAVGDQLQP